MPEIENIIRAAVDAYRQFAASEPDRETRVLVSNAVRFLVVDLASAAEFVAANQKVS